MGQITPTTEALLHQDFQHSGAPVLKIQIEEDEGFFFSRQKKERKKKDKLCFQDKWRKTKNMNTSHGSLQPFV